MLREMFTIVLKSWLLFTDSLQKFFFESLTERACIIHSKQLFCLIGLVFQTYPNLAVWYISPFFQSGNGNDKHTSLAFIVVFSSACGYAIVVGGYLCLRVFLFLWILCLSLFSINSFFLCVRFSKERHENPIWCAAVITSVLLRLQKWFAFDFFSVLFLLRFARMTMNICGVCVSVVVAKKRATRKRKWENKCTT